MEPAVCVLQVAFAHLRVNLRSAERGVTEHLLDQAKVSASREHVRCAAVPQAMRVDMLLNAY